jgi:hypothetical protein
MEGGIADILEYVRRERGCPCDRAFDATDAGGAAVHEDYAGGVAADDVAPTDELERAGPAVGVQRSSFARRDDGLNDPDGFIFEEQLMMCGSGDQGIEMIRPFWCRHGGDYKTASNDCNGWMSG